MSALCQFKPASVGLKGVPPHGKLYVMQKTSKKTKSFLGWELRIEHSAVRH